MQINWQLLLIPEHPVAELVVRGSAIYLLLFLALRFVLKRQSAGLGISDLLVIVLIADAAQNGMVGDERSLTGNALVVLTILFWSYLLDRVAGLSPALERLLRSPPLPLIRDGRLLRANMRRESITREEIMSQLREVGINDVAVVKTAMLEGDGRRSVIRRTGAAALDVGGSRGRKRHPEQ